MAINLDQLGTARSERVRYFSRQLITVDDMLEEQNYFREKLRRHNRYLHGWGVVCGCEVVASPLDEGDKHIPWRVQVNPGYVITPRGDEIEVLGDRVYFDLAGNWRQAYDPCAQTSPCSPAGGGAGAGVDKTVYLAICYSECSARPVRIQADGCGCDASACEYSRIRESFELVRLDALPESHNQAIEADQAWRNTLGAWIAGRADPFPLPTCKPSSGDPCVVLASIVLPASRSASIGSGAIDNGVRRNCLSVETLAGIVIAGIRPE